MLWSKSWQETRLRFVIGLIVLMLAAGGAVLGYPQVLKLLPAVPAINLDGEIGRRIKEAVELQRNFRGYVWSQWFAQNLSNIGTIFAVLLGSGSPITMGTKGAALFTLSLPVSRTRVVSSRALAGLSQLLVLAFVPSLMIVALAGGIGERYAVSDAFVHGLCWFVAASVFFNLAILLSTIFDDLLRPIVIACAIALVASLSQFIFRGFEHYGIYAVMNGESYFRSGSLPWLGLFGSAVSSALLFYGAVVTLARREF